MSTFQQRALVPFYLPVTAEVTTTPTTFLLATSGAALAPYLKSYLGGAVSKGFQATLHSMVLYYASQDTAASVTAALVSDADSAQSPLSTLTLIPKPSAANAGAARMDTPFTSIFICNPTTGDLGIRLATNAGTLTVQAVVLVLEFHTP